MANVFTYSFEDTSLTFTHPGFGNYSAYGTGLGSLSVAFSNDISSHDVASDCAVVVSKWAVRNGTVTIEVLQSSDLNKWLRDFTSWLETAESGQFALATMDIVNKSTGDTYHCAGVTPQKKADNQFNSTASRRTWTLLCADISSQ